MNKPSPDDPGFWYMAGPYSDNPTEHYEQHLLAAAILVKQGYVVYSPIVHCHNMAAKYELPTDAEFWKRFNHTIIEKSNGVLLIKFSGWEKSGGVKEEINFCFDKDIPVWGIEPLTVVSQFLTWTREV